MADYPPYVDAYGTISKLFEAIVKAAVPPKFTQDFISSILGLKSTSYRAMIPLLKRLGFIDSANVPTEAYKKYRDESLSASIMAQQIKSAYAELYKAHEYAQKLAPAELQGKLRTVLGVGEDDTVIPKVAGTFSALVKLADFDKKTNASSETKDSGSEGKIKPNLQERVHAGESTKFGLSYTINLNLPATTEVEVFNAIFKSLREYIFGLAMITSDALKVFGMQNLMLETVLAQLEAAGVEIGHANTVSKESLVDVELFENDIRQEAYSMADLYVLYYCFENSVRRLISGRLSERHGSDWWETKVPKGVRDAVSEKQQKEKDTPVSIRSEDPLAYSNFGELIVILEANWTDFADTLRSKKATVSILGQFNQLRNVIAHSCYLSSDERLRLQLLVKDWLRIQT